MTSFCCQLDRPQTIQKQRHSLLARRQVKVGGCFTISVVDNPENKISSHCFNLKITSVMYFNFFFPNISVSCCTDLVSSFFKNKEVKTGISCIIIIRFSTKIRQQLQVVKETLGNCFRKPAGVHTIEVFVYNTVLAFLTFLYKIYMEV